MVGITQLGRGSPYKRYSYAWAPGYALHRMESEMQLPVGEPMPLYSLISQSWYVENSASFAQGLQRLSRVIGVILLHTS